MFLSEEFWCSAVFVAIGGIISVLVLKLLENKRATQSEIRRPDHLNGPQKRPQEHDERFC